MRNLFESFAWRSKVERASQAPMSLGRERERESYKRERVMKSYKREREETLPKPKRLKGFRRKNACQVTAAVYNNR